MIEVRIRKAFLLGLRRVLKAWGIYRVSIDDDLFALSVGADVVATVKYECLNFSVEWHKDWKEWEEFQSSDELQAVQNTIVEMISKNEGKGKGKKGGKGKMPPIQ